MNLDLIYILGQSRFVWFFRNLIGLSTAKLNWIPHLYCHTGTSIFFHNIENETIKGLIQIYDGKFIIFKNGQKYWL